MLIILCNYLKPQQDYDCAYIIFYISVINETFIVNIAETKVITFNKTGLLLKNIAFKIGTFRQMLCL